MTAIGSLRPAARLARARIAVATGVLGIALCEAALFADVLEVVGRGSRWYSTTLAVRMNITPVAWCFYLVACLGGLTLLDGLPWLRRFRHRFWVCWLWSVPAWCYFDWINFYFMTGPRGLRAWEYVGLPDLFADRLVGYLIAFGAIAPGMFLSAEILMRMGFRRVKAKAFGLPRWVLWGVLAGGIPLMAVPVIVGGPISNLALWVGTFCVLDPVNAMLGRPSILVDWSRGRWGRTLALGAGGLWCGFLWEFWNYWAITKWQYHLPFLGSWEKIKYFEMPVPGLAGFIAFGIQTWVMWQTALLVLWPFVEGEGAREADRTVRDEMCF